jgi:hypothetical protein
MSEPSILTGLRLPKSLNDRARAAAEEFGIPRNTYIRVVLAAALAAELRPATLTPEQEAVVRRAVALARGEEDP